MFVINRVAKKPGNLEFDNLGKKKPGKTWNLRKFENNLEKPGILYKSHGKTWSFSNLNFLTIYAKKKLEKPGI